LARTPSQWPSIPDTQVVSAAGHLALLDTQWPDGVPVAAKRRVDSKPSLVRLEGWDSRDADGGNRRTGSKPVGFGRNSRCARSIRREPSLRHSPLDADRHALQRGSRSATTIERWAAASDLARDVGFTGVVESIRALICPFRCEHSLLATDDSAVRRK
jgi:hypothetical protein